MFKEFKKTGVIVIFLVIAVMAGYFGFFKKQSDDFVTGTAPTDQSAQIVQNTQSGDYKTFVFDQWHGSTDVSTKFRFQYPAGWFNEGQYFSPEKIQFYTKYEARAPIWFDLVLAEIFEYTELKYKIDNSKRKSQDTVGKIDGRTFKRYDLVDYGTYGGESAGHVKIFVGPTIKIDGQDYILVFHWEEKPLAEYMTGNSVEVFSNILLTLKFEE